MFAAELQTNVNKLSASEKRFWKLREKLRLKWEESVLPESVIHFWIHQSLLFRLVVLCCVWTDFNTVKKDFELCEQNSPKKKFPSKETEYR